MGFPLSEEIWEARSCRGGVWAAQWAGGGEEEGAMLGGAPRGRAQPDVGLAALCGGAFSSSYHKKRCKLEGYSTSRKNSVHLYLNTEVTPLAIENPSALLLHMTGAERDHYTRQKCIFLAHFPGNKTFKPWWRKPHQMVLMKREKSHMAPDHQPCPREKE